MAEFGSVDIWVNNAGLAHTTWSILDTPTAQVDAMVTTNMFGTINGSVVAADGMRAQGGGKIRWLTGGKIAWRMLKSRFVKRPEQFTQFGL